MDSARHARVESTNLNAKQRDAEFLSSHVLYFIFENNEYDYWLKIIMINMKTQQHILSKVSCTKRETLAKSPDESNGVGNTPRKNNWPIDRKFESIMNFKN